MVLKNTGLGWGLVLKNTESVEGALRPPPQSQLESESDSVAGTIMPT
jgi:hypothetical protein